MCHAATANSFIVRSNGTLCKCTVALDAPANRVGRLLEDGRVEIDTPAMTRWTRGLFSGESQALGCPLRGLPETPLKEATEAC